MVRAHGHSSDAADIEQAGDSIPDGYDAVTVGASIHMGKHEDPCGQFSALDDGHRQTAPVHDRGDAV